MPATGAAPTATENGLSPVPAELVALTVNTDVPAAVGVPDSTPADDSVSPGGSVPVNTDQVIGLSPVAVNVCVYATPTTGAGTVTVVTTGATAAGERLPYRALNACPPKVFASNVCNRVMSSAD